MKIGRIETFYVPPRWLFVRVEADMAKEDAVGPRDRLVAEVHGLGAGIPCCELSQAVLHMARAATRSLV